MVKMICPGTPTKAPPWNSSPGKEHPNLTDPNRTRFAGQERSCELSVFLGNLSGTDCVCCVHRPPPETPPTAASPPTPPCPSPRPPPSPFLAPPPHYRPSTFLRPLPVLPPLPVQARGGGVGRDGDVVKMQGESSGGRGARPPQSLPMFRLTLPGLLRTCTMGSEKMALLKISLTGRNTAEHWSVFGPPSWDRVHRVKRIRGSVSTWSKGPRTVEKRN